MRIDVLLKTLCLARTREIAKRGCEAGSVKVNGAAVKPSREVREGDVIEIRYPDRVIVVELTEVPARQVSKKDRARHYRIIREAPLYGDGGGWNA